MGQRRDLGLFELRWQAVQRADAWALPEAKGDHPLQNQEATERFEDLYRSEYGRVLAYCLRRTSSVQDAEDAAAETFGVAWNRADVWSGMEHPAPWLYGVARKVIGNQRRASMRYGEISERSRLLMPEPTSPPEDAVEVGQEVEMAWAALERLSASQRGLILLMVWEELTYEAAADVLGISVNRVRSRLYRARRRLREEYSRVMRIGGE